MRPTPTPSNARSIAATVALCLTCACGGATGLDVSRTEDGPGLDDTHAVTRTPPLDEAALAKITVPANDAFDWWIEWEHAASYPTYAIAPTRDGVVVAADFSRDVDFAPGQAERRVTPRGASDAFASRFTLEGGYLATDTWGAPGGGDSRGDALFAARSTPDGGTVAGGQTNQDGVLRAGVWRFDADGSAVFERAYAGGGLNNRVTDIAVLPDAGLIIAGQFERELDLGERQLVGDDATSFFVARLDATGGTVWAHALTGQADGPQLALSDRDSVYVAAHADRPSSFGNTPLDLPDGTVAYLLEITLDGELTRQQAVGTGQASVFALTVDAAGAVLVGGVFRGQLDVGGAESRDSLIPSGDHDAYLIKFSESGAYAWARTWGGPRGGANVFSLATDGERVFAAGRLQSGGLGTMTGAEGVVRVFAPDGTADLALELGGFSVGGNGLLAHDGSLFAAGYAIGGTQAFLTRLSL